MTKTIVTAAVCVTLLWIGTAGAAMSDEDKCLAGRPKAKGKYEACVEKWLAKYGGGINFSDYVEGLEKLAKCRIKYADAVTKLQALVGSPTCGGTPRFVDNGNGTVTDNFNGLVWEKKGADVDIHNFITTQTWSTVAAPPYNGDGTAFTSFLAVAATSLNEVGFAGANDWRLPTFAELQTILLPEPYPCVSNPCVDPLFNTSCTGLCTVTACSCTYSGYYWSATTSAGAPSYAWYVSFLDGSAFTFQYLLNKTTSNRVRAVRGGW